METKLFEIRDAGTFIPMIGTKIDPYTFDATTAERYLMRRAGYGDGHLILLARLDGGGPANYDVYAWGGRTYPVAHQFIQENWVSLESGAVVDVEFILGERAEPKRSEAGDRQ